MNVKTKTISCLGSMVLGILMVGVVAAQPAQPAKSIQEIPPEVLAYPDWILFNGKILTVDDEFSIRQAIAIRGAKILATGDNSRLLTMAGPETRTLDLQGKTALPGFIDSHLHLGDYAMDTLLLENKNIDWEGKIERIGLVWRDPEMALRDVARAVAAAAPGEWIILPTREGSRIFQDMTLSQLDEIAPDNPLAFKDVSQGGRPAAANSQAIQEAKLSPSGLPQGKVLISGKAATQLAQVLSWVLPLQKVIAGQRNGMTWANGLGLTTVVTRIKPEQFTALRALWLDDQLTVRWRVSFPGPLWVSQTGNLSDIGDDWLRISGATGGAVPGPERVLEHWSSRVPATSDELASWPVRRRQFLEAIRYGWSVPNTHIKGDLAVREVLDLFDEALSNPVVRSPNQRLTMDHMQEIQLADIRRLKDLGVTPSSQMIDIFCDEHPKGSSAYASVFGPDHVDRMLPIKTYLEHGIHPTVEGDSGDHKHGNPLWGIEKLVCRCVDGSQRIWGRDQRITRQDALRMKTIWAAAYSGDQNRLGSLEAGKLADLVVLDRDYLNVAEDEISDLKVLLTMVGGNIVHSRLDAAKADERFENGRAAHAH